MLSGRIVGYVTLSAAQIERAFLPKPQQRNRPDPLPVTLLGQLAVDKAYQGQGHAVSLLLFALKTALSAAESIGSMGVVTHPLDDNVRDFYARWGFQDEKAFHDLYAEMERDEAPAVSACLELVHVYGLRPDLLAVTQVWKSSGEPGFIVGAKGSPEAIAALCRLDPEQRHAVNDSIKPMASRGLRVLGVARASFGGDALPDSPREFAFAFLGLVGLADPLRPSVPDAVRECRSAGIRVVMITGDYPETAAAIARDAGLDARQLISGEALDRMTAADLASQIGTADVFARIMPEQKLRIVNALKASGEIVAMTGDGVNDAPSLKAAHIGVAMGGRGTDVALTAASGVVVFACLELIKHMRRRSKST